MTKITVNRELSLWEALIPVVILIGLLTYNVNVYGDEAISGSNQFILLISAAVAALIGFFNKVSYKKIIERITENVRSTTGAILILLLVGALTGTWLISGIIPGMIYYGLQILNPVVFLPATVVICCIVSLATGSSWSTSATVGVALIGIGTAMGVPAGMMAGAVISGAYFGDKMSPLSDTTNLAAAMAGTNLFSHIQYMLFTTGPSILITLVAFTLFGFNINPNGNTDAQTILTSIENTFHITGWVFIVPIVVIGLILFKTEPLIALLIGVLLGGIFAILFQPHIVAMVGGSHSLNFQSAYKGVVNAITVNISVDCGNKELNDLFTTKGMEGMLGTIWLVICSMAFGGAMEAIGGLTKISSALLKATHSVFGLFASTVASCLAINITASDQYLAIVVPGKMFSKAYEDKGLAPENLSRSLEDSGTVTSVLVPWNTCGAYQSGVLGVNTLDYLGYAIFNYISPFMTLLYAAFRIKIKMLIYQEK